MLKEKEKEKEHNAKMKALRRELEEKLEEQLPPEMLEDEKTRVEVQRIDENIELPAERAKQVIEALLFASAKPVMPSEIRRVMKFLAPKQIQELIAELRESYVRDGRSFEILEIAGGYEIASKKEFAPWILKIELQKKAKQVTQSALETLSIMAYKQPITRAEIEELRGVDAGGVVNTLMERGLIKIVGKKEVPGRPFLYGTTEKFLEHFGLKSLQDLPNIDEIRNLVEKSVKKEELLGKTNLVDVAEGAMEAESTLGQDEPAGVSAVEGELSEEIVSEDETVSAEESESTEEDDSAEGVHESQ